MKTRCPAFTRILFTCFIATLLGSATVARASDLSVTVRDENGTPIADAVVTVTLKAGGQKTEPPSSAYQINQKDTAYDPFVSVVSTGTSVNFKNSDSWGHHVYSFSKAKKFDITVAAYKVSDTVVFEKPGIVVIGCNIHDRMLAYIFVSGEGMPSKSNKMGIARFFGLPSGTYHLEVWHPTLRSKRKPPTADVSMLENENTQIDIVAKLKRPGKKKRKPYKY